MQGCQIVTIFPQHSEFYFMLTTSHKAIKQIELNLKLVKCTKTSNPYKILKKSVKKQLTLQL